MNVKGIEIIGRWSLLFAMGLLLAAGSSCRSRHAQKQENVAKPAAAPATVEKAPAGTTPGKAGADSAKPGPAATPTTGVDPAAGGTGAEEKGTPDRDELWKCYQEVYCAQKKGEMEKILDIYKKFGFETPQEFTRVWIEAAKDTDWVSKLANDVSKKCR